VVCPTGQRIPVRPPATPPGLAWRAPILYSDSVGHFNPKRLANRNPDPNCIPYGNLDLHKDDCAFAFLHTDFHPEFIAHTFPLAHANADPNTDFDTLSYRYLYSYPDFHKDIDCYFYADPNSDTDLR
jgi:hypothetical protein